jgi:Flp pilus assembly protein protease CpaA
MLSLYLALIGLVVGLALDAIIVRLAVPPDEEEEDTPQAEPQDEAPGEVDAAQPAAHGIASVHAPAPPAGGEAGSLVVGAEGSGWLRRLLVVGATAGLFAAAADRYDGASHLAVITAYLCVLLVCAATDALSYRVPNAVTYPAILGAVVVGAAMPGADLFEVLAGGALAGGVLLLPAIFTGGMGMGMGDVKLATFIGLALGFAHVALALVLMALAGGAAATLLLVSGRRKRSEPIPYAPFISLGALAALLWPGAAFVQLV